MYKTYKGGDIELIEKYLDGAVLEWHNFNKTHKVGESREWHSVLAYEKPFDVYRVSNTAYTFREKQVAKQYVKLNIDVEVEGSDYHDAVLEAMKRFTVTLHGGDYEPCSYRDVELAGKIGKFLEELQK